MELWASGFNAWGQLDFEELPETRPGDLKEFKCILRQEHIETVRTTLSATLVRTSTGLRVAGCSDNLLEHCISKKHGFSYLAIAGNGKVVEMNPNTLKQYNCFDSYLRNDGEVLRDLKESRQIVANQTTFTALLGDGEVWTWGDGRYEACLGREVSKENPAAKPYLVEDLVHLPTGSIRKISSGGYVTAALTEGNDLYIWGGRPGQPKLLEQLTGRPTPVDLDGEDVLDVAVDMNHVIALTTEHKLFVVGDGSNGQLGLDLENVEAWNEVLLPLKQNQRIVSVHTGYNNSLVTVEDIT